MQRLVKVASLHLVPFPVKRETLFRAMTIRVQDTLMAYVLT